jgi:NAD(P)H-dependent flavin oxidoreductase YrpB (nitropropane dioxygenase family)
VAHTPDQLDIDIRWIRDEIGDRPFGVDLLLPTKYAGSDEGGLDREKVAALLPVGHQEFLDDVMARYDVPPLPEGETVRRDSMNISPQGIAPLLDVAFGHPIRLIASALGPPPPYLIDRAHGEDVLVAALAGKAVHAERHAVAGADIIVAQGTEAGGHCGDVTSMVLWPEVVDAVGPDVPVLAAGGIGSGRQIAAALALGTQGVWTGSIWLTVAEADTNPLVVENLLAATSRDTVRARVMTGKPARLLRSAWSEAWDRPDAPEPLPMPLQGMLYGEAARRISRAQNKELSGFPVGQIVGSMNRVRPTKDVMLDLVEEWIEATQRVASLLEDT